MSIQRLYVQNFRSFRQIDLALPEFSVLVGANAAGKSNFVQIFRFLRDVAREGFENAIALQGGVEYLRNFTLGASVPLEIRVCTSIQEEMSPTARKVLKKIYGSDHRTFEIHYELLIEFAKRGSRYRITHERLHWREWGVLTSAPIQDKTLLRESYLERVVGRTDRAVLRTVADTFGKAREKEHLGNLPKDVSVLQRLFAAPTNWFRATSLFDFDIKSLKKSAPLESRPQLAEDGGNLATIIRRLAANPEQRRRLQLHLRRFLPFIADVKTQATMEKAVAYQIQETYSSRLLPSQLLSDGTAEALALIVALYFTPSSVTLIEEPDRNLHPALIERLVNACQEVSTQKPVIITTHNPEVVRYAPFESLLLIERDSDGFSTIRKPSDSAMVQEFLKHELMPHDLFVDNLLGV